MSISRRHLLGLGGLSLVGAAGLALPLGSTTQAKSISTLSSKNFPKRYAQALRLPTVLTPQMVDGTAVYDITARQSTAQIIPGLTTPVYAYNGEVPGPVIKVNRGTPSRVIMRNRLPRNGPWGGNYEISTHLHGSASNPEFDGYASDVTKVGQMKAYEYPNLQPARTLWYHDHGQHWTAQNAYSGLAAQYHLHDDTERALLPQGEFDVPLTVTDAIFLADGRLKYDDSSHSGLWGDVILVNGTPWPTMKVKRRTYRFRILDASIARSYRWRLDNGMPLQVVATDGGLMPQGVAVSTMRHGGAERYEVVVDFSRVPATTKRVELLNMSNPNNVDYDFTNKVMAFDLSDEPVDTSDPTWNRNYDGFPLAPSETMSLVETGAERRVRLRVERANGLWTINGKTWENVIASEYRETVANPALNEVQVWEIENRSGGWFHPVHIHLIDFKVIGRTGGSGRVLPHENGPKDVVYVGEGETVRLLIKFSSPTNQTGRYMVHCHNLPHEDHDMMQQFKVGDVDDKADPHDPMTVGAAWNDPTFPG
ncbi:multicopper oxidase family protein [Kineococcus gynurae]|uniref:Multicopper oxidase family protein n=1 Tax=Kineococcus gynurae TaxID=452979 RepID=A0ABV5LWS7_9ACTN